MRTLIVSFAVVCFAFLTSGCNLAEKYQKNNSAAQAWIQSNSTRPAAANFEGLYYSPGWGPAALNQSGNKITGIVDFYHVNGVVSGSTAYLVLVDDDWAQHTMVLARKSPGVLAGTYSPQVPFSAQHGKPVRFDRIEN